MINLFIRSTFKLLIFRYILFRLFGVVAYVNLIITTLKKLINQV